MLRTRVSGREVHFHLGLKTEVFCVKFDSRFDPSTMYRIRSKETRVSTRLVFSSETYVVSDSQNCL